MRVQQQLQKLNQLLQPQLAADSRSPTAVSPVAMPGTDAGVAGDAANDPLRQRQQAGLPSVQVDLSPLGRKKSQQAEEDKDIEDSELPDAVKNVLKRMRQLKREIEEKRQELEQLMQQQAVSTAAPAPAQAAATPEAAGQIPAQISAQSGEQPSGQQSGQPSEQQQQLNTELNLLNKALISAQDSLRELLANGDLTEQQIMTAMALAAKG